MNAAEQARGFEVGSGEIDIFLTADEKAAIRAVAESAGLSIEAWIISRLEEHVRQKKKQQTAADVHLNDKSTVALFKELGEEFDKLPATQLKDKLLAAMETLTTEHPKSTVPKGPDIFSDGNKAPVINNQHSSVVLEMIMKGGPLARWLAGGWYENQFSGDPQFLKQLPTWHGGSMMGFFEAQARNAAELWAKVEAVDMLYADVYLGILGAMGDPRNKAHFPLLTPVIINSEQLLEYANIRRHGHNRDLLKVRIAEDVIPFLKDLTVEIRGIPYGNRTVSIPHCKVFDIVEVYEDLLPFPGEPKRKAVGWAIRAGMWANFWFQEGGRYWVSAMSRLLLTLDHRQNRRPEMLAKKIGLLLLTVEGGTDSRNYALTKTIRDLLGVIGELPNEGHRGENWANRLEAALREALNTLLEHHLLESVKFSDKYPDSGDRGRGWVERWLDAEITLTTPEAAMKLNDRPAGFKGRQRRNRGTGKPRKPLLPGRYLTETEVAAIRRKCAEQNRYMKDLAREMGVAAPTLSNALRRREAPSDALLTKLKAFLNSPVGE